MDGPFAYAVRQPVQQRPVHDLRNFQTGPQDLPPGPCACAAYNSAGAIWLLGALATNLAQLDAISDFEVVVRLHRSLPTLSLTSYSMSPLRWFRKPVEEMPLNQSRPFGFDFRLSG